MFYHSDIRRINIKLKKKLLNKKTTFMRFWVKDSFKQLIHVEVPGRLTILIRNIFTGARVITL